MKRILACILVVLMMTMMLASCDINLESLFGQETEETPAPTETETETEEPTEEPTEEETEPVINIDELPESSEGLVFELNEDEKGYTLTDLGTCTAEEIVIGKYNNLPVTDITATFKTYKAEELKVVFGEGVMNIGDYTFSDCTKLKKIDLPVNLKTIGVNAFSYCTNLESLILPEGIKSIEEGAFTGCDGISTLTIPQSVTTIGKGAFSCCSSLKTITISQNVKYLGDSAFSGCTQLENIIVPTSVRNIGAWALGGCTAMKTITYQGSKAQWKAIKKDSKWSANSEAFIVKCTDGNLARANSN